MNRHPAASAEIRPHNGRPTVFVNGQPLALPTYSPRGWDDRFFHAAVRRFAEHRMGAYFVCVPHVKGGDFFANPFWRGDDIRSEFMGEPTLSMDEQAAVILEADPNAWLIVRTGPHEPPSWRELHPDQLVVNERGQTIPCPSLASELFRDDAVRFTRAFITYCEARPWAHRIIGYWNGLRFEGTHEPLVEHWLYDHSPLMTARWRKFLRDKYQTVQSLREVYGDDSLSFDEISIPRDPLLNGARDVAQLPYFMDAARNQPMRDYLLLVRDLFHEQFRAIASATRDVLNQLGRKRFCLYDALKQPMLGWSNYGFFNTEWSWPAPYAELMAGSGHMDVADLLDSHGVDGVITPHDYQARGIGGVFIPEGCTDSCILRGRYFMAEMDTRTWCGQDHYGRAENQREFDAITWRNLADALTRGYNAYWMDLHEDWFAEESMHHTIGRQVEVIRQSLEWPHQDVPGIAMVLDDSSILQTNGNGAILNEHVMWEQKMGIARCGVPYRVYLLQDLLLGNFPPHKVIYFPNLYQIDDARLEMLKRAVLRDGRVIVWGPGSGISDGRNIGPDSATRLTGFKFDYLATNEQRRMIVTNFDHPITCPLPEDSIVASPLAFGPALFPRDGIRLASAWTKQGRNYGGMAVKTMNGFTSLFTCVAPLPAGLWREIARFAGCHIYCQSNDVLMGSASLIGLHTVKSGLKRIELPGEHEVTDVINGQRVASSTGCIEVWMQAPQTSLFHVRRLGGRS